MKTLLATFEFKLEEEITGNVAILDDVGMILVRKPTQQEALDALHDMLESTTLTDRWDFEIRED